MARAALRFETVARLSPYYARHTRARAMTVMFPWAGRDINSLPAIFGRAAFPNLRQGAGFNWSSMVGTTGFTRPALSGLGALAYRRMPRHALRGLGQFQQYAPSFSQLGTSTEVMAGDTGTIPSSSAGLVTAPGSGYQINADGSISATTFNVDVPPLTSANPVSNSLNTQGLNTASPLYSLLGGALQTGSQIASFELNPLLQKQTFYTTPQGTIYASNAPGGAVPGAPVGTGQIPVLPIIIGGGVLLMMMMFMKKS